jgi:hypothetical protein
VYFDARRAGGDRDTAAIAATSGTDDYDRAAVMSLLQERFQQTGCPGDDGTCPLTTTFGLLSLFDDGGSALGWQKPPPKSPAGPAGARSFRLAHTRHKIAAARHRPGGHGYHPSAGSGKNGGSRQLRFQTAVHPAVLRGTGAVEAGRPADELDARMGVFGVLLDDPPLARGSGGSAAGGPDPRRHTLLRFARAAAVVAADAALAASRRAALRRSAGKAAAKAEHAAHEKQLQMLAGGGAKHRFATRRAPPRTGVGVTLCDADAQEEQLRAQRQLLALLRRSLVPRVRAPKQVDPDASEDLGSMMQRINMEKAMKQAQERMSRLAASPDHDLRSCAVEAYRRLVAVAMLDSTRLASAVLKAVVAQQRQHAVRWGFLICDQGFSAEAPSPERVAAAAKSRVWPPPPNHLLQPVPSWCAGGRMPADAHADGGPVSSAGSTGEGSGGSGSGGGGGAGGSGGGPPSLEESRRQSGPHPERAGTDAYHEFLLTAARWAAPAFAAGAGALVGAFNRAEHPLDLGLHPCDYPLGFGTSDEEAVGAAEGSGGGAGVGGAGGGAACAGSGAAGLGGWRTRGRAELGEVTVMGERQLRQRAARENRAHSDQNHAQSERKQPPLHATVVAARVLDVVSADVVFDDAYDLAVFIGFVRLHHAVFEDVELELAQEQQAQAENKPGAEAGRPAAAAAQAVQPAQPAQPAQSGQSAQPAQPVQPARAAQPVQAVRPVVALPGETPAQTRWRMEDEAEAEASAAAAAGASAAAAEAAAAAALDTIAAPSTPCACKPQAGPGLPLRAVGAANGFMLAHRTPEVVASKTGRRIGDGPVPHAQAALLLGEAHASVFFAVPVAPVAAAAAAAAVATTGAAAEVVAAAADGGDGGAGESAGAAAGVAGAAAALPLQAAHGCRVVCELRLRLRAFSAAQGRAALAVALTSSGATLSEGGAPDGFSTLALRPLYPHLLR